MLETRHAARLELFHWPAPRLVSAEELVRTTRNKKKTTERLQIKKYCPFCRTHVIHKESK